MALIHCRKSAPTLGQEKPYNRQQAFFDKKVELEKDLQRQKWPDADKPLFATVDGFGFPTSANQQFNAGGTFPVNTASSEEVKKMARYIMQSPDLQACLPGQPDR